MKDNELQAFLQEVMSLDPGYPGMGGASTAIMGATSTNKDVVLDLRRNAMDFAAEYTKDTPDHQKLAEFAGKLEGSLRSLHLVSSISEQTLQTLLNKLNGFVQKIFG